MTTLGLRLTARHARGGFGRGCPLTAALGLALLCFAEASALMVPLATTTVVDHAECIVEGRVAKVTPRWTADRTGIVTEVVVDATDVLLGETNQVTFLYEGGVVDGLEQRVSDMPSLTEGQQILVFLRAQTESEAKRDLGRGARTRCLALFGGAQGVCRIEGGRAIKDGFTVPGGRDAIDSDVDVGELKARVRQRLRTVRPERKNQ